MSFLRKKIAAELPEEFSYKVFQLEQEDAPFEKLLHEILSLFSDNQLNLVLEFEIGNERLSDTKRIAFLQALLTHIDALLREKAIQFLEPYLKEKLVPLVTPLITDDSHNVRVRVYWVLEKYTTYADLLELILLDFKLATEDNELIFLAAALYLLNNSPDSYQMQFLKKFYIEHYFDPEKNDLKVSLTGVHGYPAQIIGLILWEAGIELFAVGSLKMYDMLWLIEKE